MGRAPIVHAVGPGVGAGLDAAKFVTAIRAGDGAPTAAKVGVQRCQIAFFLVTIPPARIGLPDLQQGTGHTATVFIQDPPMHDDARANRACTILRVVVDQIAVLCAQHVMAKHWRGFFAKRAGEGQKRGLRAAFDAGFIRRGQRLGLPVAVAWDIAAGFGGHVGTAHKGTPISAKVCLASLIAWLAFGTPA